MTFLTDHEQPTGSSDNLDEQELTQEAVTRQENDIEGTADEEKVTIIVFIFKWPIFFIFAKLTFLCY